MDALKALVAKFLSTKDPADYKVWSDAYDAAHPITDDELRKVAGGGGNDGAPDIACVNT